MVVPLNNNRFIDCLTSKNTCLSRLLALLRSSSKDVFGSVAHCYDNSSVLVWDLISMHEFQDTYTHDFEVNNFDSLKLFQKDNFSQEIMFTCANLCNFTICKREKLTNA